MYFLIDYENVNYAGLEGTEFLEKGALNAKVTARTY